MTEDEYSDRDPWDPPEPVDLADLPREQLKTSDMCADITGRLLVSQQNDPPLYPELVQMTLRSLARAAADGSGQHADWARWLLEQLHHRAASGVPYGEPIEQPWEQVLSDGDGDLG